MDAATAHQATTIRRARTGASTRGCWASSCALVCLGVVMVASSSMAFAVSDGAGPFHYLIRHLMFLAGGLGMAFVMMRTEIKKIEQHSHVLLRLVLSGCCSRCSCRASASRSTARGAG